MANGDSAAGAPAANAGRPGLAPACGELGQAGGDSAAGTPAIDVCGRRGEAGAHPCRQREAAVVVAEQTEPTQAELGLEVHAGLGGGRGASGRRRGSPGLRGRQQEWPQAAAAHGLTAEAQLGPIPPKEPAGLKQCGGGARGGEDRLPEVERRPQG
ncbi:collagen alpha-2(I) chain-like [Ananas comosus]|uniref:Collagen alpha-2(I) chain-like n=1 Tax=Ananas comosus TaxID=4615 RepID=A0A6P5G262_ANACO|nr:collagen alpha-2(I) chain-like [Ananas comosus]